MRKILIGIVIIPLLAIGLGMTYVWYNSKKQVDEAIAQMAVFARVKYSSLFVSPFGAISMHNIRITPHDSYSDFTIEKLRLQAPDLWALINLQEDIRRNNIPESLQLSAEQLTIPVYGLPLDSAAAQTGDVEFSALGCGEIASFGIDEYVAMGYETFVIDQNLGYRYDKRSGQLVFNSQSVVHDSADISAELVLNIPAAQDGRSEAAIGPFPLPDLVRGQFVYSDQSFNQRRNDFCAQQAGVSVAVYVDRHIELAKTFLAANSIVPSEGLVSVYRDFITAGGGDVNFQFNPAEPLDLTRLALYQPHQLLAVLQPQLAVNGTVAEDIALSFDPAVVIQEPAGESAAELIDNLTTDATTGAADTDSEDIQSLEPVAETAVLPTYTAVDQVSELPAGADATAATGGTPVTAGTRVIAGNAAGDYIGRSATVIMAQGKQYTGRLTNAHDSALQISVRMGSGEVGYWLNVADISEIQIHQ